MKIMKYDFMIHGSRLMNAPFSWTPCMRGTISVTEAVRNFADFINRVAYRGEQFTLERGGRPVARLVPVPQSGRLGDLPGLLASVPPLGPDEGESLALDLEAASTGLLPLPGEDPWES